MKNELTLLKQEISNLTAKNLELESEVGYLKGKIKAYEWFLSKKGFIKGDKNECF